MVHGCVQYFYDLAIVVVHLDRMSEVGTATPNCYWTILIKYRLSEFPLNLVALTRTLSCQEITVSHKNCENGKSSNKKWYFNN